MSGLGGLNKSPDGVVIGLVQSQLPVVVTKADLAAQANKICALVTKARKGMPTMDLVVFPEYSLHGLSMDTNPRSEEHTSELQSRLHLVCRLLLEKKKNEKTDEPMPAYITTSHSD